jgi:hypothetical protein
LPPSGVLPSVLPLPATQNWPPSVKRLLPAPVGSAAIAAIANRALAQAPSSR